MPKNICTKIFNFVVLISLWLFARPVLGGEALIAVASNFQQPMKSLADDFQATTQHTIRLAFGASGKFSAQIQHGAPFDALFSADQAKIDFLVANGLGIEETRFTYAEGVLVLWSSSSVGNLQNILRQSKFNKLALANPKLAPYGKASVQVLENLELDSLTRKHWVMAENIAQAYHFVASGNAQIGFAALSQIRFSSVPKRQYWMIPTNLYQPIKQDAIIVSERKNEAILAFFDFLQSAQVQKRITEFGYRDTSIEASQTGNAQ